MQKNHIGKILALGIIVLFIGVGIHPVFANEDKASSDTPESLTNINDEFYENSNCLIIGRTTATYRATQNFKGNIYFGYYCVDFWDWTATNGYIITIGKSVNWKYEGKFYGRAGHSFTRFSHGRIEYIHYCGIEGFKGFGLGGTPIFGSLNERCFFIGYVDYIKISPNHP